MKNTAYHEKRINNRYSSYLKDGLPSRFVFVLTNKCNLSCDFCFQDRKSLAMSMTENDWLETIVKIPPGSHITFTGGEPLLFKNFSNVFNAASDKNTINIICNGVLLSNQVIDLLLSSDNFMVLSISVDTIGNINRKVKVDDYSKMIGALSYFKEVKKRTNHSAIVDITVCCRLFLSQSLSASQSQYFSTLYRSKIEQEGGLPSSLSLSSDSDSPSPSLP
jgi:MoaA/NifB/PqqE/SkfB family radical SAM enzyme